MKILRYKKMRNGTYQVCFDDGREEIFFEDVILRHELLIKKSLKEEELVLLKKENKEWEGYALALKFLSRSPKSKGEVRKYLKEKGVTAEAIDQTICKLIALGYLDDLSYAKSYVHDKMLTSSHGPKFIKRELLQKDVAEALIDEALLVYQEEEQKKRALKIANKMVRGNRHKGNRVLLQKIEASLKQEGFIYPVVEYILTNLALEEGEDIAKKEYEKAYQKLSRKYQGKELEYKIKQKMYQLGFPDYKIPIEKD